MNLRLRRIRPQGESVDGQIRLWRRTWENAPSMNRTCNPLLRKEMLYPIELWGHKSFLVFYISHSENKLSSCPPPDCRSLPVPV